MALTPQQRVLRARLAAHGLHAKITDESAHTAPARKAFNDKFLAAASGDPVKAEHLRKAHFARLALASSKARAARKVTNTTRRLTADPPAGDPD